MRCIHHGHHPLPPPAARRRAPETRFSPCEARGRVDTVALKNWLNKFCILSTQPANEPKRHSFAQITIYRHLKLSKFYADSSIPQESSKNQATVGDAVLFWINFAAKSSHWKQNTIKYYSSRNRKLSIFYHSFFYLRVSRWVNNYKIGKITDLPRKNFPDRRPDQLAACVHVHTKYWGQFWFN